MEGKEAIINKIFLEANEKADALVKDAEDYALELKENAEIWSDKFSKEQNAAIKKDADEIVKRRKIVADLEVRKIILKAKQDAIGEVFDLVYKKLCGLSKSDYLEFVRKAIEDSCEDGDVIILSDDGVLSPDDFKGFDFYAAKKLSVQKERGNFVGGVKLVGKFCDKDLTFKGIIESKKDDLAFGIAQKLFG